MKAWEVWYAKFPYEENHNEVKFRPVIVLDADTLEVLSVKVTSHEIRDEDPFDTPIKYWKECGLKKPSVARVSKTMILTSDRFDNKKGELHSEDQNAITKAYMDFVNSK